MAHWLALFLLVVVVVVIVVVVECAVFYSLVLVKIILIDHPFFNIIS